jgi:nucleoside-diphosphate-sugar epimerase
MSARDAFDVLSVGNARAASPGSGVALMRLFCFGYGYSARHLAARLAGPDVAVAGTRTRPAEDMPPDAVPLAEFKGDAPSEDVRTLLAGSTHVLVSIPPDLEGDVVLRHFGAELAALGDLVWVGYLSTVGVYGDRQGQWVDETTATRPTSERSLRRVHAERAWLDFAGATGKRVEIFRLAGIYGRGRSVIDNLRAGTAKRIVKAGQVFNRIHVADVANVLAAAIGRTTGHAIYNVGDNEPAPPQDVVAFAAGLLNLPVPPAVAFEDAGLRGMAASFWAENKRIRNARIREDLGVVLDYPTYREGLKALAAT